MCANEVEESAVIHPDLLKKRRLLRDSSLKELLNWFAGFESIMPKEVFESKFEACLSTACAKLSRVYHSEADIRNQFDHLLGAIAAKVNGDDDTLVVELDGEWWHAASGFICKELGNNTGLVDKKAGIVGKTHCYLPFGSPAYNNKAFFVAEGKFVTSATRLPWYTYSKALTTQLWGSFFGHDACVAMPFNLDGCKIIYRVLLSSGRYQIYQFPPGDALLDFKYPASMHTVTKIFMEIARIGMRRVTPLKAEARKQCVSFRESNPSLGDCVKIRQASQETEEYADKLIAVEAADGEVIEFVSLDLYRRIGNSGIIELEAEMSRRDAETRLNLSHSKCSMISISSMCSYCATNCGRQNIIYTTKRVQKN